MRTLSKISGIRLKGYIQFDYSPVKRDFYNFFRTFKPVEENTEDNHFYSPFFAKGDIIRMSDNYGDRINPLDSIYSQLKRSKYLYIRLEYDFTYAAVNEEYYTDNEFKYTIDKLEKACKGTDLYIAFMVSHFNQLVGKPAYLEKEHYHILLSKSRDTEQSIKKFLLQLKASNSNIQMYLMK